MGERCHGIVSELRQLLPDAVDYPPVLRRCSEKKYSLRTAEQ